MLAPMTLLACTHRKTCRPWSWVSLQVSSGVLSQVLWATSCFSKVSFLLGSSSFCGFLYLVVKFIFLSFSICCHFYFGVIFILQLSHFVVIFLMWSLSFCGHYHFVVIIILWSSFFCGHVQFFVIFILFSRLTVTTTTLSSSETEFLITTGNQLGKNGILFKF